MDPKTDQELGRSLGGQSLLGREPAQPARLRTPRPDGLHGERVDRLDDSHSESVLEPDALAKANAFASRGIPYGSQPAGIFALRWPRARLLRRDGLVLSVPHRVVDGFVPHNIARFGLCVRDEELEPKPVRSQVDGGTVKEEESYLKGGRHDKWKKK